MRRLSISLALFALVAVVPTTAEAQVQVGPTLAFHDDFDFGIGGQLSAQMPSLGEGIGFMGDIIVFFPDPDGLDYLEINGNVTYDFPLEESSVVPFALGGLNIARASFDGGTLDDQSNTEIGLNLGGGIVFDAGSFRPSVGGRFEVNGGEGFVLFFTLPFEVSGN